MTTWKQSAQMSKRLTLAQSHQTQACLTWSFPRSPTITNIDRWCCATPFSIWTRMRLSTFFRKVAIVSQLQPVITNSNTIKSVLHVETK